MVRNYVHKREKTYDEKTLKKAVNLVLKGNTLQTISKKKKIPKETLRRWVTSPPSKIGSGTIKRVLTKAEEKHVLRILEEMAKCGWPNGLKELKFMIKTYLDSQKRLTAFKFNLPGKDWMIEFKKRWGNKKMLQCPELKNEQRFTVSAAEAVNSFFKIFDTFLTKEHFQSDTDASARIFTVSEIACSSDPKDQQMLLEKTSKYVYFPAENIGNNLYTILVCGSAEGKFIEPLVVYKGKRLKESWTHGGPTKAQYTVTENGWMTEFAFEKWFKEAFIPFVADRKKPMFLLYDSHVQRLSYGTIMMARIEKIIILCLPPHTGHALQPLYVGIFQQLNEVWSQIVLSFFQREQVTTVTKKEFPALLKDLWDHVFSDNLIGGFKKTGLWPIDQSAVKTEKYSDGLKTVDAGDVLQQSLVSVPSPLSSVTGNGVLNSKNKLSKEVDVKKSKLKARNLIKVKISIKKESHCTSSNAKWKSKVKTKEKTDINDLSKDDICLNCGQTWSTYEGTDSEVWLICDGCDKYVCPKCIPPDTDLNEDFFCMDCVK